jgi:hypothetical protein
MIDCNDANPISTKNKKGLKYNNKQLGTLNATSFFEFHNNLFMLNTMDIMIKLEVESMLDYMLMVKVLVLLGIIQLNYLNI